MKAKDEKNDIEEMVNQASQRIDGNVPDPNETPELESEDAFEIDYDNLQKKCDRQARKLIKDATGLMMNDEMVKQNPYIKNKMEVDKISLSGMLYQMKVNQIMQQSLMEEVRKGASHPRMFEVFGQLSKTISELNKQLLQTVEAIKDTYKNVKYDIHEKQNEDQQALNEGNLKRGNNGELIAIGSKDMIKQTKMQKKNKKKREGSDITDASIAE